MEQKSQGHPQGIIRLEVWLFLAMLALGLLGFMSPLSGGEVPGGGRVRGAGRRAAEPAGPLRTGHRSAAQRPGGA